MGFHIEINSIIRTDNLPSKLEKGKIYEFENEGSRIYFDDIPVWLIKRDWTAVAEVQIVSQLRENGFFKKSKYKVLHLYSVEESKVMTSIFKRMYGWK